MSNDGHEKKPFTLDFDIDSIIAVITMANSDPLVTFLGEFYVSKISLMLVLRDIFENDIKLTLCALQSAVG